MRFTVLVLFAIPSFFCIFSGSPARAGFLPPHWHYSSAPATGKITLDAGNQIAINMKGVASTPKYGTSDIVIASVTTSSSLTRVTSFSNLLYFDRLTIVDDESHVSRTIWLSGLLNGSLSHSGSNLTNTYWVPPAKTVHLGHYLYTVSADPFTPPNGVHPGFLRVHVEAHHNPEPSTLVLATIGGASFVLMSWRKWRRGEKKEQETT